MKKAEPFVDEGGRFIAYCDYSMHRGVVLRPRICERRDCRHYYKFYIKEPGEEERLFKRKF